MPRRLDGKKKQSSDAVGAVASTFPGTTIITGTDVADDGVTQVYWRSVIERDVPDWDSYDPDTDDSPSYITERVRGTRLAWDKLLDLTTPPPPSEHDEAELARLPDQAHAYVVDLDTMKQADAITHVKATCSGCGQVAMVKKGTKPRCRLTPGCKGKSIPPDNLDRRPSWTSVLKATRMTGDE